MLCCFLGVSWSPRVESNGKADLCKPCAKRASDFSASEDPNLHAMFISSGCEPVNPKRFIVACFRSWIRPSQWILSYSWTDRLDARLRPPNTIGPAGAGQNGL